VRKYENFFIVDPDLPDEGVAGLEEKIRSVVQGGDGVVLNYTSWGKKRLAYTVRKRNRGQYILMEFSGTPGLVAELERNMRLDDRVLKFITVKLEDRFEPAPEPEEEEVTPSASEEESPAEAVESYPAQSNDEGSPVDAGSGGENLETAKSDEDAKG
jgi:small subunit ribosomal protein S6